RGSTPGRGASSSSCQRSFCTWLIWPCWSAPAAGGRGARRRQRWGSGGFMGCAWRSVCSSTSARGPRPVHLQEAGMRLLDRHIGKTVFFSVLTVAVIVVGLVLLFAYISELEDLEG